MARTASNAICMNRTLGALKQQQRYQGCEAPEDFHGESVICWYVRFYYWTIVVRGMYQFSSSWFSIDIIHCIYMGGGFMIAALSLFSRSIRGTIRLVSTLGIVSFDYWLSNIQKSQVWYLITLLAGKGGSMYGVAYQCYSIHVRRTTHEYDGAISAVVKDGKKRPTIF